MENGFGHSVIQVDTEPAIIQLAETAAKELGLPWRHSTTHTSRTRYRLKTVDDDPETVLPWILQHACFTIN
eukprot:4855670-Amphidinium_carterae.4